MLPANLIRNDYEQLEQIGDGNYGVVYRARHLPTGQIRAIKKMNRKKFNMKLYKAEIEQLRLFDHDNIMRYFDDFEFNEDWYIVMEYCENGDLGRLRMRVNCLNEPVCKNIIVQLLSAIAAMHEKNTAHRDIKPANVLIDGNYDLKLADFGLSRHNNQNSLLTTFCGTPQVMAPEIYESAPYDLKCDIWSLGCITYEFLFQTFPYVINEKGYNAQQEIIRLREKMKKENYSFPKNVAVSDECKHFISRCLLKDPTKRASANQLLADPWLKDVNVEIARNFIRENLADPPDTIAQCRQLVCKAFKQFLQKLFEASYISAGKITDILIGLKRLYENNTHIYQVMLLMATKKVSELLNLSCTLTYQQVQHNFELRKIQSFMRQIEAIKQIIKKEDRNNDKLPDTNLEKTLITWAVDEGIILMDNLVLDTDRVALLEKVCLFCVDRVEQSEVHIDTSNHKFFKQTRKVKEAAVLVGWINDGFYEKSEFVGNLPIKHNLTIVSRPGIEIEIGKTIAETFKINLACK